MRKINFENNQFYHVYNRGNNKRPIFLDRFDLQRFIQGIVEFNCEEPIGSIFENAFREPKLGSLASKPRLVDVVAYCLNPNHFHLILKQQVDDGVSKFMHRQGTGYTKYFNEKYKNSGSLFQGPYKAIHVDSNEYLLHLSAYVNLNSEAHNRSIDNQEENKTILSISSWQEYVTGTSGLCNKDIILSQFNKISEYEKFALDSLATIRLRKDMQISLELELGSLASK